MPNPVKCLGYIKCHSSSSSRPVKSPSNSIRQNYQKICSWSRKPKTILEISKKITFLWVIINTNIYKFFKDFTKHKKKTNMAIVFSCRPFPNIQGPLMRPSTFWKTRHILKSLTKCMKVQAHNSLEPPLEYNQDQVPLMNQGSLWPF